jgi:hypothetical protein
MIIRQLGVHGFESLKCETRHTSLFVGQDHLAVLTFLFPGCVRP